MTMLSQGLFYVDTEVSVHLGNFACFESHIAQNVKE